MSRGLSIDQTIDAATPPDELPKQVPPEIWEYARGFLKIPQPSVRFVWRDASRWLDVHLLDLDPVASSQAKQARAQVRITETELPRGITAREFDVLTLVALGLTNVGIAARLGTAARTVSTHIERLLGKLDQSTRGGMAALAVDAGLLCLPMPGGPPESGGIGVAELELAVRRGSVEGYQPIRTYASRRAPIVLGVVVPQAPGVSGDAQQLEQGVMLAVDEINEQGGIAGRRIDIVRAEVSFFDWLSVRAGLAALIDAEVDAIVTSYVSAEHPEFLEVVADYGRPFLHTATYDADVLRAEAQPFRYRAVFQTCASETHYGPGMLRFVQQLEAEGTWSPRTRRIVSIEQGSSSMRMITPALRRLAATSGWELLPPIEAPVGETDWGSVVATAAAQDPDVLFIANYLEDELVAFQEALLRSPLPALVYSVYAPSIPSFIERLGAKADGVIWSTITGTYNDELGRGFLRRFRERYGTEPGQSQAGAAYDQVRILAAAWSSVDAHNVTDVIRYLRRWPHRGVNGVYYFGDTGHAPLLYPDTTSDAALSQAHLIYQIRQSQHVLLAPEPFGTVAEFRTPHWVSARQG